jgi:hypothetical protein
LQLLGNRKALNWVASENPTASLKLEISLLSTIGPVTKYMFHIDHSEDHPCRQHHACGSAIHVWQRPNANICAFQHSKSFYRLRHFQSREHACLLVRFATRPNGVIKGHRHRPRTQLQVNSVDGKSEYIFAVHCVKQHARSQCVSGEQFAPAL